MVALACATGIPVSAWLAEDDRVLWAALELMSGGEVGEQQDGGGRVIESG